MSVRLLVENYRVLRKIDWELPKGVCGLVGPNGSGKTTLLDMPALLRDLLHYPFQEAFTRHGTEEGLLNDRAQPCGVVTLGVSYGAMKWKVEAAIEPRLPVRFDEEFPSYKGGRVMMGNQKSVFANMMVDSVMLADDMPFRDYRLYSDYRLQDIRQKGSLSSASMVLEPDGSNVFSVLRNWDGKQKTKARFAFVVESLREAFADTFEGLDFDPLDDGRVSARIHAPGGHAALPILHAASGFLTGLLHLTAVASTAKGGIIAIDEPENGLHPYAIKRLVQAMRDWGEEEDLTVLLATHSPMLLDQFKQDPERLFVMEPGREVLPVRLDQVHNREWLSRFSLGDLYKAGDFGAPKEGAAA